MVFAFSFIHDIASCVTMSNLGRDAAVQHLLRGQTGGKQPNSPAHAISAGPFGFPPTKRQTPSFQPTLTPGKLDQTGRSASKASLMRRPLSPLPVPTRRRSGSHATTPVGAPRRPATRIPSSPLERTAFMPTAAKSRRTRTGCLTCRERHLKCDEGLPECVNCRKSSRECRRGMRLNFIDTKVRSPPHVPQTADWSGTQSVAVSLPLCLALANGTSSAIPGRVPSDRCRV